MQRLQRILSTFMREIWLQCGEGHDERFCYSFMPKCQALFNISTHFAMDILPDPVFGMAHMFAQHAINALAHELCVVRSASEHAQ